MSPSHPPPHLLLCCALPAEASPLARAWKLKKRGIPGVPDFWVDEDQSRFLLASGLGKIHQAAAVGAALAFLAGEARPLRAINLGLAASHDSAIPLGRVFQVLKVTDRVTGRAYYPDLLQSPGLSEAQLITVDQPVSPKAVATGAGPPILFDMEASGFWPACQRFLPSDAIHCLKVLSDHGLYPAKKIPVSALKARWDSALPTLVSALESLQKQPLPEKLALPESILQLLPETADHLRLTATQTAALERTLLQRETRARDSGRILKALLTRDPPVHAHERKNQFEALLHELLES